MGVPTRAQPGQEGYAMGLPTRAQPGQEGYAMGVSILEVLSACALHSPWAAASVALCPGLWETLWSTLLLPHSAASAPLLAAALVLLKVAPKAPQRSTPDCTHCATLAWKP